MIIYTELFTPSRFMSYVFPKFCVGIHSPNLTLMLSSSGKIVEFSDVCTTCKGIRLMDLLEGMVSAFPTIYPLCELLLPENLHR